MELTREHLAILLKTIADWLPYYRQGEPLRPTVAVICSDTAVAWRKADLDPTGQLSNELCSVYLTIRERLDHAS